MPMYGADVEQLRTLAAQLSSAAKSLESISAHLQARIQGARWDGPDGVRFTSDWNRQYRLNLRDSARRLDDAAQQIRRNALDQERTSRSSGGSPSRPGYGWAKPGPHMEWPGFRLPWFIPGRWPPGWSLPDREILELLRRFSEEGKEFGDLVGDFYDLIEESGRLDLLQDWMKVGDGVAKLSSAVDLIGSWNSLTQIGDAVTDGDWNSGIRAGIDIAWDVGTKIPIVGKVKFAWDGGTFIGHRIYDVGEMTGVNDAVQDAILAQAVAKGHGSDLGTRYDGWGGFGNFVKDYGSGVADGTVELVQKLKFW